MIYLYCICANFSKRISEAAQCSMAKEKRTFTTGTRLTKDEFNLLSDAAANAGVSLSEWIRQTTLRAARPPKAVTPKKQIADVLLEEVMYIQEMLSHSIPVLSSGKPATKEQFQAFFAAFRNHKYDAAKDVIQASLRRK